QPLIAPLYGGKSAHELVSVLTDQPERPGYELVREHWRDYWESQRGSGSFEDFWQTALHNGVIAGTALPPRTVAFSDTWRKQPPSERPARQPGLEIVFRPDPSIYDGQFANNGWLQELPKPLTKLTWDNAALMSPRTAQRLGLSYRTGTHG